MGPNLTRLFEEQKQRGEVGHLAYATLQEILWNHGEALIAALEKAAEIIVTLEEQYESTFHYEDHREFMELLAKLESEAQP